MAFACLKTSGKCLASLFMNSTHFKDRLALVIARCTGSIKLVSLSGCCSDFDSRSNLGKKYWLHSLDQAEELNYLAKLRLRVIGRCLLATVCSI
jgi:hypothetical protein